MDNHVYECIKRSHLEKLSDTEDLFEFVHQMREAYHEFLKLTQTKNKESNRIAFYRSCWKSQRVRFLSSKFQHYAVLLKDQDIFYKNHALRCGAAMIDNTGTFMLLTQGFDSDWWTVPIGRQNSIQERAYACMVREVHEETGFEVIENEQPPFYEKEIVKVFLVPGLHIDTSFRPQVQYEIRKLARFSIPFLCSNKMTDGMAKHFHFVLDIARQVKERIEPIPNEHTDRPEELPILKSMEFDFSGNILPDGVKWREKFELKPSQS